MNTMRKKKEKNSTVETNFDRHGNTVLMFETFKEVDQEKIIK